MTTVSAVTRRELPPTATSNAKLTTLKSGDTSAWPKLLSEHTLRIFFSGLGTTRMDAGGKDQQWAIDHDANLALAQAAKECGASTYVLISSAGANEASNMFYMRMKGTLDNAVQKLGFRHVVIVRPGLIVGPRESKKGVELLGKVANLFGSLNQTYLKDTWAQDAEVIARAAVRAGMMCDRGERKEEGVWILDQPEILKLGREEWSKEGVPNPPAKS